MDKANGWFTLIWVGALSFFQCFDVIGWTTGGASSLLKAAPLIAWSSVSEQAEEKNQGGNCLMQIQLENGIKTACMHFACILLSWAVCLVLVVQVVVVVSAALHAAVRYCYGKSNEKPAIWSQASYGVGLRYERNSTGESKWSSGNWPEGTVSILVKELVSLWYCVNLSRFHLFHRFISGWLLVWKTWKCQGI